MALNKREQIAKDRIRTLINEYDLTGDLTKLAEAILLGSKILKKEEFPIVKFALHMKFSTDDYYVKK